MSTDGGGEEPRLVITFRIATHTHVHRRTHAGSGERGRACCSISCRSRHNSVCLQGADTAIRLGEKRRSRKQGDTFLFPPLNFTPQPLPPTFHPSIIIIPTPTITLILPPTLPSSSLLSSPPSPPSQPPMGLPTVDRSSSRFISLRQTPLVARVAVDEDRSATWRPANDKPAAATTTTTTSSGLSSTQRPLTTTTSKVWGGRGWGGRSRCDNLSTFRRSVTGRLARARGVMHS